MATRHRFAPRYMFQRARRLRKNATREESILWSLVRGKQLGIPIRRQHPIDFVIVDFYCPRAKVAIELDGAHHDPERDKQRDIVLARRGILVMRFENFQLLNDPQAVVQAIQEVVLKRAALLREDVDDNEDDV